MKRRMVTNIMHSACNLLTFPLNRVEFGMKRKKNMPADQRIDLYGVMVPVSVLQANRKFSDMNVGEILEIRNCDPETLAIFFKVIPKNAYVLLSDRKTREPSSLNRIRIKKQRRF